MADLPFDAVMLDLGVEKRLLSAYEFMHLPLPDRIRYICRWSSASPTTPPLATPPSPSTCSATNSNTCQPTEQIQEPLDFPGTHRESRCHTPKSREFLPKELQSA